MFTTHPCARRKLTGLSQGSDSAGLGVEVVGTTAQIFNEAHWDILVCEQKQPERGILEHKRLLRKEFQGILPGMVNDRITASVQ